MGSARYSLLLRSARVAKPPKGLISEKLKEYWSPEQIMGRLELDKKIKISTETAYRFTNTCAISIRNIENAMAMGTIIRNPLFTHLAIF
jgi:IS30 family transposase